jgi:hypothetical protein
LFDWLSRALFVLLILSLSLPPRFFDFDCVSPSAQPLVAVGFFMAFTTLSAFVVLSLFVGTITLGMVEAMGLIAEIEDTAEAHAIHRSRCDTRKALSSLPSESSDSTSSFSSKQFPSTLRSFQRLPPDAP